MYDDERVPAPAPLKTDRNGIVFYVLNLLTLGLYSMFFFMSFQHDIDKITTRHSDRKAFPFLLAFLLSYFTVNIVMMCWFYQLTEQVELELARREINYDFNTSNTFWGWYFFGSLILVGPMIFCYRLCHAMNLICEDYNRRG